MKKSVYLKIQYENINSILFFLFILIIIGYFILESFTPLHNDDFKFVFFQTLDNHNNYKIFNFEPFNCYYSHFGGVSRFIPHLFVKSAHSMGHILFSIIASVSFFCLCYLSSKISSKDSKKRISLMLISSFLLINCFIGFFEACQWMSGICNYLFVSILILLYYNLIVSNKISKLKGVFNYILLFIFGLLTGWTNEGFVVGLSAGCFFYYMFHITQLNSPRFFLLLGLYLGTVLLCLSPFNLYRFFSNHSSINIVDMISDIIFLKSFSIKSKIIFFVSFLFFLVLFCIRKIRYFIKLYIKDNLLLILILIISFCFLLLTRHTSIQSRFPSELYAMLLFLKLLAKFPLQRLQQTSFIGSISLIILFFMITPKAYANYNAYENMATQICNGNKFVMVDNIFCNKIERKYICPITFNLTPNRDLTPKMIAKYYGKNYVPEIISKECYKILNEDLSDWRGIHFKKWEHNWIILPINIMVDSISINLKPTDFTNMSPVFKVMAKRFDRFTINKIDNWHFICYEIDDVNYLVIEDYPYDEIRERIDTYEILYHKKEERDSKYEKKIIKMTELY